jgi:hypothetical protein
MVWRKCEYRTIRVSFVQALWALSVAVWLWTDKPQLTPSLAVALLFHVELCSRSNLWVCCVSRFVKYKPPCAYNWRWPCCSMWILALGLTCGRVVVNRYAEFVQPRRDGHSIAILSVWHRCVAETTSRVDRFAICLSSKPLTSNHLSWSS